MIELADIFGYAGVLTGISFMLPQVYRSFTTKSVKDVSWGMLVLFSLNCFIWLLYGILINSLPIAIANALALMIAILQIALKFKYRSNQ